MPKARLSSPLRRIIRFTEKYSQKVVPLRYKLYLPHMRQLLDVELTNLDELERQIYGKLEDLGVSAVSWPFYMAFSKRCFDDFIHFSEETAEDEVGFLRQEFIWRDLDSAILDQLVPICRDKAEIVKGS